jgi:hypothetical protein
MVLCLLGPDSGWVTIWRCNHEDAIRMLRNTVVGFRQSMCGLLLQEQ